MDALDAAIAEAQEKVDHARRSLEKHHDRLIVLQEAARLRPYTSRIVNDRPQQESRPGGRQPGAISNKWRMIFKALLKDGNRPRNYRDIMSVASHLGFAFSSSAMRSAVRRYVAAGLMIEFNNQHKVSEEAIARYNLLPDSEGDEDASNAGPETGLTRSDAGDAGASAISQG